MTRLKLLSSLLCLQLLGPALRSRVAAFDVLMVIGKLSVNGVTSSLLESEIEVLMRIHMCYILGANM